MDGNDIPYVFIDQFYTGNLEEIQSEAVLVELRASLSHYEIDMDALFRRAMERTMVQLSEREITSLKERFLKKSRLCRKMERLDLAFVFKKRKEKYEERTERLCCIIF